MSFSKRLKYLREEKGLSQIELSKEFNISRQSISNYENGLRFPNDEKLIVRIAEFFNVSIDYLFGKTNIRNSNLSIVKEEGEEYSTKINALERLFYQVDKLPPSTIEKISTTIELFKN